MRDRKKEVEYLKRLKESLLLNITREYDNINDSGNEPSKEQAKTYTKTTAVGKKMAGMYQDNNRQQGYVQAIMLGLISFAAEIGFITIAFLLYRAL